MKPAPSKSTRRRPPLRRLGIVALTCCFAGAAWPSVCRAQAEQYAIWVMKPDGSEARMLAQVQGCKLHKYPRWSRDSKRVAFNASPGSVNASSIYVVNADGSGLEKVGGQTRPDWSPDGKQLAYDAYSPDRTRHVYVQNLDGEGRTQVAPGISPRWSPDGSQLAISDRDNVCVVDLVSGERRVLLERNQVFVWHGFAWFPDGKRLVVVTRPEPTSAMRRMLFLSTRGEDDGLVERFQGGMNGFVAFSPDGKKLVCENVGKIALLDVDGSGGPREIPDQKGTNVDPDWSADGEWIVFASNREVPK
jgi:Tol biopolymer transport system component